MKWVLLSFYYFKAMIEVAAREVHCVFVDVYQEILKKLYVNRNV